MEWKIEIGKGEGKEDRGLKTRIERREGRGVV